MSDEQVKTIHFDYEKDDPCRGCEYAIRRPEWDRYNMFQRWYVCTRTDRRQEIKKELEIALTMVDPIFVTQPNQPQNIKSKALAKFKEFFDGLSNSEKEQEREKLHKWFFECLDAVKQAFEDLESINQKGFTEPVRSIIRPICYKGPKEAANEDQP